MMPKIIVLGLLIGSLTGLVTVKAQTGGESYPDSLEKVLVKSKDLNQRLETLSLLADWYVYRDLEKTMFYLQKAEKLGWQKWNKAYLVAKSYGTAYQLVGYYDSAVYWQNFAYESALSDKNDRYIGITANNLSNAYYSKGQFDSAFVYALRAIAPARRAGNLLGEAISKELVAILENEFGDLDSSLSYFQQSAALYIKANAPEYLAGSYVNTVEPLVKLERYDEALVYVRKAEKIYRNTYDPHLAGAIWFAKAHVLTNKLQLEEAWTCLDSSQYWFEALGATGRLDMIVFERGRVLYTGKKYAAAKELLVPLLPRMVSSGQLTKVAQIYTMLADIHKAEGNFPAAFDALKQVELYRDTAEWISVNSELAGMAVKYALDKSNTELANLAVKASADRRRFFTGLGIMAFSILALGIIVWLVNKNRRQTERLNAQLGAQNAFKDKLFASIGHDLRSPLAQSYAALRIMRRKLKDLPELESGLAQVQAGQWHALQVTDDLLGWVALQWGGEQKLTDVDLKQLVEQVVGLNQNALEDKQVQVDLPQVAAPSLQTDAQAVALLLRNFLSNAIKFSPAGGKITVAWGVENQRPWLSISDHGKGFPAAWLGDLQALASRNDRLPSQKGSEGEPGTGLGLMLCATFARQIHTHIFLETAEGGGAKVKMVFPATKASSV